MQFRNLVDPPPPPRSGWLWKLCVREKKRVLTLGLARWTAVEEPTVVHFLSFKHSHHFMKL